MRAASDATLMMRPDPRSIRCGTAAFDHDIEAAGLRDGFPRRFGRRLEVSNVRSVAHSDSAAAGDPGDRLPYPLSVAIENDDGCPRRRQLVGDAQADTPRAAGHDGGLALKSELHSAILCPSPYPPPTPTP